MDLEHTLHFATNLAIALSNKMYSSYSNQRLNSNVLRLTPPGFKHPIDVQFPPRCLPVCGRCKKNFKTREHCRGRDCHTDLPWCDTYVCVSLDKSCTDGNGKLLDGPFAAKVIPPVGFTFKEDELDPLTPICAPCKDKNYTRTYCRQHKNHRQLPWSTVYVVVSLDTNSEQHYYLGAVVPPAESSCTSVPSMVADAEDNDQSTPENLHENKRRKKSDEDCQEHVAERETSSSAQEEAVVVLVNDDEAEKARNDDAAVAVPPVAVLLTSATTSCGGGAVHENPTNKQELEAEESDEVVIAVERTAVACEHNSSSPITRQEKEENSKKRREDEAPTIAATGEISSTVTFTNGDNKKKYSEMFTRNNIPRSRTFLATVSSEAKRIEWVDIDPMLQCRLPFYRETMIHPPQRHSVANTTTSSSYYSRYQHQCPPLCSSSSFSSRAGDDGGAAMFYSSSNSRDHHHQPHMMMQRNTSTSCSMATRSYKSHDASRGGFMNHINSSSITDGGMFSDNNTTRGGGYDNNRFMTGARNSSARMCHQKHNYYQQDPYYNAAVASGSHSASPRTYMPHNASSSYDCNDNKNGYFPPDYYKTEPPYMENTMMYNREGYAGYHGCMGAGGMGTSSTRGSYPESARMHDMRMSSQMQQMGGPIPYHTPSSSMNYPSNMEYGGAVGGGSGFHHHQHEMMQHHEDMNLPGAGDDRFPQRTFDRSQMMNNMSAFKPVGAGKMNPGAW